MDADLEARLRVIADQQEIHDLLVRYCRGVDRRDPRLILDAFHEDGTDGHGQGIVTRDLQPLPALSYSMELALVISRLRAAGVRITPGTYLGEIGEREATVYDVLTGEKQVREVDAVVLATMRRPQAALARELRGRVHQPLVIGDAAAARGLVEATFEAHRFARTVGEPDAPRTLTDALFRPPPSEAFARSAAALLAEAQA